MLRNRPEKYFFYGILQQLKIATKRRKFFMHHTCKIRINTVRAIGWIPGQWEGWHRFDANWQALRSLFVNLTYAAFYRPYRPGHAPKNDQKDEGYPLARPDKGQRLAVRSALFLHEGLMRLLGNGL